MLSVPRGNTKSFVVTLADAGGTPYLLGTSDTLIFGVKENVETDEYILSKSFGSTSYDENLGGYKVNLDPEDTSELEFGKYVYDVGLQKGTGEFFTVCPCDTFEVAKVVTKKVV